MEKLLEERRVETLNRIDELERLFNKNKHKIPICYNYDYFEDEYFTKRKYVDKLKQESDLYEEYHDVLFDIVNFIDENEVNVDSLKKSIVDEVLKILGYQLKHKNDYELPKMEENSSVIIDDNISPDKLPKMEENTPAIIDNNVSFDKDELKNNTNFDDLIYMQAFKNANIVLEKAMANNDRELTNNAINLMTEIMKFKNNAQEKTTKNNIQEKLKITLSKKQ